VRQSPLYYTRTRGLFRECYPGPKEKAPFPKDKKDRISKYSNVRHDIIFHYFLGFLVLALFSEIEI
jgi:hypothetical protein